MRYKFLIDIELPPEETASDFVEKVQNLLNTLPRSNNLIIEQVNPVEDILP